MPPFTLLEVFCCCGGGNLLSRWWRCSDNSCRFDCAVPLHIDVLIRTHIASTKEPPPHWLWHDSTSCGLPIDCTVAEKSNKCWESPEALFYRPRFVSFIYTEWLPCWIRGMFLKTWRLRRHFCRLMEVGAENKAAPTGFALAPAARSQMIWNTAHICRVLFSFHRRGFIWLQRDSTLCDNVGTCSILWLLKLACFVDTAERNNCKWLNRVELWCNWPAECHTEWKYYLSKLCNFNFWSYIK